jgi:signal peptidase II
MKKRFRTALIWAAAVLVPDQITKALVLSNLALWESRPVIPGFFNIVHVVNRGAAFGFLNSTDTGWQTGFFIAVTLAAVGFIGYLLASSDGEPFLVAGLGLVLGGALGNLADRVRFGSVVDFLDVFVGELHWPAFNVADSAISLGAAAVLVSLYRKRSHASRSA